MNKKLFASAMFAVAAFLTNAASAVTYDNSETNGGYQQTGNAKVGAGGAAVRANDLIVTAQSSGVSADIPAGSEIIVRLPKGLNFDGAPSYMVTTGSPDGLTLVDDSEFGDPTRDAPKVELFDANNDGGMDRAVVTVKASGQAGDIVVISSNIVAAAGTKATSAAKASVIVNGGLAVTQPIADIVDSLPEPVAGPASSLLASAQSVGQTNVALWAGASSPTIIVTIPAGTVGSKTITISKGSGIGWASGTGTTASIIGFRSPVTAAPVSFVNAVGTNTTSITLKTNGSPLIPSKFDVQVEIKLDALDVSAGAVGQRGVVFGGDLGLTGNANLVDVKANGSDAMLTSTKVDPTNTVKNIVAGSNAFQTLPSIDVTESFSTDAVGPAGTPSLTITAGSGLIFAASASQTLTITGGTTGTIVVSGATSNTLTITFATRDAGSKLVRIAGIQAKASGTASGNLSVTVGGAKDKTTAPNKAVVVANAVPVGTVTATLKDKSKKMTGPTGVVGSVTSNIKLVESTYGAVTTAAQSQVENAYFKLTPSTGSTITNVVVTTAGYLAQAPAANCSAENVPGSTAWICLVTQESNSLQSGTSTITVAVTYYGNAKGGLGSPPAAVVGSTIAMAISGNAGVSGSVDVADVVISTKLSKGEVPDLTPGDTEAQAMAKLTITEQFANAITTGNFRLVAPEGVTFNNSESVLTTQTPAGTITTTPTITATFNPNDTLVINIAVATGTISFVPRAIVGPNASGWLAFSVVNGDINGANGANITAETINLGYADGTLDALKAGDDVDVVVGFKVTNSVTGGLNVDTGYTAKSDDTAVATAKISGNSVVVTGVGVGTAKITVMDELGASDTVDVTVTAAPAPTEITKVEKLGGGTTAAKFSAAASADGGATFSEAYAAGENVTVAVTVDVDPVDEGKDGIVVVAIKAAPAGGPVSFAYLDTDGNWKPWDLTVEGLGGAVVAEPLADVHNVSFDTGSLQAGLYKVYFGYMADGEALIYTGKAFKIQVSE
jgi:hypothetical protein